MGFLPPKLWRCPRPGRQCGAAAGGGRSAASAGAIEVVGRVARSRPWARCPRAWRSGAGSVNLLVPNELVGPHRGAVGAEGAPLPVQAGDDGQFPVRLAVAVPPV